MWQSKYTLSLLYFDCQFSFIILSHNKFISNPVLCFAGIIKIILFHVFPLATAILKNFACSIVLKWLASISSSPVLIFSTSYLKMIVDSWEVTKTVYRNGTQNSWKPFPSFSKADILCNCLTLSNREIYIGTILLTRQENLVSFH